MRNHNEFYENLEFAQKGEERIADKMVSRFPDLEFIDFGETSDGDIHFKCGERDVLVEVKEDVRASDTGNVVIECESRGKPSGIRTTKADFWVFVIHTTGGIVDVLFKVNDVKQAIRDRRFFNKRQMEHTDSNNVLYFFKVDTLLEYKLMDL